MPHYTATQRCTKCDSADTTPVFLCKNCAKTFTPSGHRPDTGFPCPTCGWNKDVEIKVSCQKCGHMFPPSDVTNPKPVLPCGGCKDTVPHSFVRNIVKRSAPRPGAPNGDALFEECIFACGNGHERVFGTVGRR